jgi:hypothetical protein
MRTNPNSMSSSACYHQVDFGARKPTSRTNVSEVTTKASGFLWNPLAYVNAVAVRIGEDECALAIFLICQ